MHKYHDLRRGIYHIVGSITVPCEVHIEGHNTAGVLVAKGFPANLPNGLESIALSMHPGRGVLSCQEAIVGHDGYAICEKFNPNSHATTGEGGIAIAGLHGTAQGGAESVLVFPYFDSASWVRYAVFRVGERGVLPDTPYSVETTTGQLCVPRCRGDTRLSQLPPVYHVFTDDPVESSL